MIFIDSINIEIIFLFKINGLKMKINKIEFPALTLVTHVSYRFITVPQWTVGRENPCNITATIDAPSVFFYVANALAHQISVWGSSVRLGVITGNSEQHTALSMVAQAGQLSSWPVSVIAGILTPVWATTLHERENSGGSKFCYITEIIIMMATPTQSHPQFIWLFLAVCRSDMADQPHRKTVTAPDERTARRMLAAQFVLFFAGRLPVQEVYHG